MTQVYSTRVDTLRLLQEGHTTLITIDPSWMPPRESCRKRFQKWVEGWKLWFTIVQSYGLANFVSKRVKLVMLACNPISRTYACVGIFIDGRIWLGCVALIISHLSVISIWLLLHHWWGTSGPTRIKAFREAFNGNYPNLWRLFLLDFWLAIQTGCRWASAPQEAYARLHLVLDGTVEGVPWALLQLYILLVERTSETEAGPRLIKWNVFGFTLLMTLFAMKACRDYLTTIASITHEGNIRRFWLSLLTLGKGLPPPTVLEDVMTMRDVVVEDDLSGMDESGAMALARTISRSVTLRSLTLRNTYIERSEARKCWTKFTEELFMNRTLEKVWFTPAFELDGWSFKTALRLEEVRVGDARMHRFAPPCDEFLFRAIEDDDVEAVAREIDSLAEEDRQDDIHHGAKWSAATGKWKALKQFLQTPTAQHLAHELACAAAAEGHVQCVQLLLAANFKDWAGALAEASARAQDDVVDMLLASGVEFEEEAQAAPLTKATFEDDASIAKHLLEAHADPNAADVSGVFPLIACAENAAVHVAEVLLAARAMPDVEDAQGRTPLWVASALGNVETARRLIAAGANIEAPGADGATPLEVAVDCLHVEAAKLLLQSRADVDGDNVGGAQLVATAAAAGQVDLTRLLLNARAQVEEAGARGHTPLTIAVEIGAAEIVELLLARGASITAEGADGEPLLASAVQSGSEAIVRHLLQARADAEVRSSSGTAPLRTAVEDGHLGIVRHLLRARANPDADSAQSLQILPPLRTAMRGGNTAMAQLLLEARADVEALTEAGVTLLAEAVERLNKNMVKFLLKAHANAEARDSTGELLLITAAERGNSDICRMLLERGASANTTSKKGKSALQMAVEHNRVPLLSALLQARAELGSTEHGGVSMLAMAIECGHREAVEVLVQSVAAHAEVAKAGSFTASWHNSFPLSAMSSGKAVPAEQETVSSDSLGCPALVLAVQLGKRDIAADLISLHMALDDRDAKGCTALTAALETEQPEVLQLLLDARADVQVPGTNDESPLTLAVRLGLVDAVRLLVDAGASVEDVTWSYAEEHESRTGSKEMAELLHRSVERAWRTTSVTSS